MEGMQPLDRLAFQNDLLFDDHVEAIADIEGEAIVGQWLRYLSGESQPRGPDAPLSPPR